MIVKNEEHVIQRAIKSVRHLVDSYAIVDTGSTDKTALKAHEALAGLPGMYVSREWQGFGHARSQALDVVDMVAADEEYALIVDADDIWSGERPDLSECADGYAVWFRRNGTKWATTRYLRLGRGIRYEGVVHEMPVYPNGGPVVPVPMLEGLSVMSPNDGASWKDPDKYLHHARLISQAMVEDPTNERYAFYLAQSYRDHGDDVRAAKLYLARAAMGPGCSPEEVYVSFLEAGRAFWRLGRLDDAKRALQAAHGSFPGRREAMAELARLFAVKAATSPTVGSLFVEDVMGEAAE